MAFLNELIPDGEGRKVAVATALVANGDFASGIGPSTGWLEFDNAATVNVVAGRVEIQGDPSGAFTIGIFQESTFDINAFDFIEFEVEFAGAPVSSFVAHTGLTKTTGITNDGPNIRFSGGEIQMKLSGSIWANTGFQFVTGVVYTVRMYVVSTSELLSMPITFEGGTFTSETIVGILGPVPTTLSEQAAMRIMFTVQDNAVSTMKIDNVKTGTFTVTSFGGVGTAGNWEAIFNTIRKRFQEQVVDLISPALPTAFDNAPFTRPDNSQWARLSIQAGERIQQDFGSSTKRFRNTGMMTVQIFVPLEKGDKAALEAADFVDGVFRSVTDAGVVFRSPFITPVGRIEKEWQVNVTCPFYADIIA